MIKLRLRRMGAKKRPSYRIVAADSRSPRDGRFIKAATFSAVKWDWVRAAGEGAGPGGADLVLLRASVGRHREASTLQHPDAVLIGDVRIGPEASIWPGAVLRGDGGGYVEIGAQTSIQDNSVLHTVPGSPTVVGERCVIGHIVHLEGCTVEDDALVGNGAIVLHRAIVRSGAIVAANSVVLNDTEVPSGAIAVGSPATIREGRARRELIDEGVAVVGAFVGVPVGAGSVHAPDANRCPGPGTTDYRSRPSGMVRPNVRRVT